MIRPILAGLAALGLVCAVGGVAIAQNRPAVSNQPIMIGADSGERTNTSFSLRGRAEVTQGDNRMRADVIEGEHWRG